MSQSKKHSLIESVASTAAGFVISVIITAIVMPAYGHDLTLSHNIQITAIFTVASIVRSYIFRRAFNHWSKR